MGRTVPETTVPWEKQGTLPARGQQEGQRNWRAHVWGEASLPCAAVSLGLLPRGRAVRGVSGPKCRVSGEALTRPWKEINGPNYDMIDTLRVPAEPPPLPLSTFFPKNEHR